VRLDSLSNTKKIARFLGTQEVIVERLLEEGRLGGVLVANLRRKGVLITPQLRHALERLLHRLTSTATGDVPGEYAAEAWAASPKTVTIMFTDIVNSTAIWERLGDRAAREVVREHNGIIRFRVRESGGNEVKSMGDGFMLTFESPLQAVECAVEAQRDLAQYSLDHPETPLNVRMGIAVGEPIREEEDYFGKPVIIAARISSVARGAQILTCQLVQELAVRSGGYQFNPLGRQVLKGISEPQSLYEVLWRRARA
jgi:class 3 adenylate cyclase